MRKGEEMALQKAEDHWAFLEEIEAPMWFDLNSAAKPVNQEFDDDWFHRDHLFHQCSSRELKHAFSRNAERNSKSDFNLQGSSSPELPTSVSGSRGRHYKSRKWGTQNLDLLLNDKHPVKALRGKDSRVYSKPIKEGKLKSKPYGSNTNLDGQRNSSKAAVQNYRESVSVSTFGDQKASLSSEGRTSQGNSSSSITSESNQQQHLKFSEVSSQSFDHKSGLLAAALRTNFRKSCITRQAYRVKVNDSAGSKDRKSPSSKSSVGSSDLGHVVENVASRGIQKTEQTVKRSVTTTQATKNGLKKASLSKASTDRVEDGTSDSKRRGETFVAKPTCEDAGTTRLGGCERHSLAAATVANGRAGVRKCNRSLRGGKENAVRRRDGSQGFCKKDCSTCCNVQQQELTKEDALKKAEKAKLVGAKDKVSQGKFRVNAARRVYLR